MARTLWVFECVVNKVMHVRTYLWSWISNNAIPPPPKSFTSVQRECSILITKLRNNSNTHTIHTTEWLKFIKAISNTLGYTITSQRAWEEQSAKRQVAWFTSKNSWWLPPPLPWSIPSSQCICTFGLLIAFLLTSWTASTVLNHPYAHLTTNNPSHHQFVPQRNSIGREELTEKTVDCRWSSWSECWLLAVGPIDLIKIFFMRRETESEKAAHAKCACQHRKEQKIAEGRKIRMFYDRWRTQRIKFSQ